MLKRLTDKYLKSLPRKAPKAGRLVIADTVAEGLSIRVTPAGTMSWQIRYRPRRQARRVSIVGPYPAISLANARQRAAEIVALAKKGIDLLEQEAKAAEAQRQGEARARLIRDVSTEFLKASERLKSHRHRKGYMVNHVLPALGNKVVGSIRRADVVELLDDLEHKKGLKQSTNRVRETLLAFFEFAIERELIDENPVSRTRRRKLENKRQRILSAAEIKALWDGLDSLTAPVSGFVRTLLLTGCRRENARTMRWSELDLDGKLWTVPADKSKNGRPYEIPLSHQMMTILNGMERAGPFVFTRSDGSRPIGGMSDLKTALDHASGLSGWRLHDLRRSLRTGLAKLGIAEEIGERVIGHSRSKLDQIYNVHEYRAEKAAALQLWGDHIDRLVNAAPAKVVPLERIRA
jgi:integrase